jgi:hypothetical protein
VATQLETEGLFAAIGLQALLDARPKLTKAKFAEAAFLPKRIRRRLTRFLGTDEWSEATDIPDFDYAKVLGQVSEAQIPTREQAAALFMAVPDRELAHDLGLMLDNICVTANGLIPREPPNPITDQPVEDPEPAATVDFRRFWQIACDPMTVLNDLEAGNLFDEQVSSLANLYPAIFDDIKQAITEVMAKLVAARGKTWEPNPTKGRLIATLKQQDIFDAPLAAAIQQSYQAEEAAQEQAAPPPPTKAPRSGATSSEATPGQQATVGG